MAADPSRQPAYGLKRFVCPRCNAFAAQEWRDLLLRSGEWGDGWVDARDVKDEGGQEGDLDEATDAPAWKMSHCASCDKLCVWRGNELIYPITSPIPVAAPDMPLEVRELYDEARAVAAVSRRAGAALARATLERLLKVLDPDAPRGSRLDDYIARVMPRVSVATGRLLTLIRHVGNKSLHVGDVEDGSVVLLLSDGDAELQAVMFGSINDVVEELITRPREAEALYASVPEAVRAAAEAKAAIAAP